MVTVILTRPNCVYIYAGVEYRTGDVFEVAIDDLSDVVRLCDDGCNDRGDVESGAQAIGDDRPDGGHASVGEESET